jgi:hypothetical protein
MIVIVGWSSGIGAHQHSSIVSIAVLLSTAAFLLLFYQRQPGRVVEISGICFCLWFSTGISKLTLLCRLLTFDCPTIAHLYRDKTDNSKSSYNSGIQS